MNNDLLPRGPDVDLHQHSTYSDGVLTPTQLVARAKARGLSTIALTDHDTLLGIGEAIQAGRDQGVRVIAGIEISGDSKKEGELHILGYHIDWQNQELQTACRFFAEERDKRAIKMVDYLRGQGLMISLDQVVGYSGQGVVARPHVAQALIEQGYVADRQEAFSKYLDKDEFKQAIDRRKPTDREAIDLIRQAGGLPVLAHAVTLQMSPPALAVYLKKLKGYGLLGIEVYHPKHDQKFIDQCLSWASQLGLLTTRGSDFHG